MLATSLDKRAEKLSARLAESQAAERSITGKLHSATLAWKTALATSDADRGAVTQLESRLSDQRAVTAELTRQLNEVQAELAEIERAKAAEAAYRESAKALATAKAAHQAAYEQADGALDTMAATVGRAVLDMLAARRAEEQSATELDAAITTHNAAAESVDKPGASTAIQRATPVNPELEQPWPDTAIAISLARTQIAASRNDAPQVLRGVTEFAVWAASTDRVAGGLQQRAEQQARQEVQAGIIRARQAEASQAGADQQARKRFGRGPVDLRPVTAR